MPQLPDSSPPPSSRPPVWGCDWREGGNEPDYRFTLANERTFLAWIRTALAVLAAAVAFAQFATSLQPRWAVLVIAGLMGLVSAGLCVAAYWRWRANEIAMRHAAPLPHNLGLPVLGLAVSAVAIGLALLLLRPLW